MHRLTLYSLDALGSVFGIIAVVNGLRSFSSHGVQFASMLKVERMFAHVFVWDDRSCIHSTAVERYICMLPGFFCTRRYEETRSNTCLFGSVCSINQLMVLFCCVPLLQYSSVVHTKFRAFLPCSWPLE